MSAQFVDPAVSRAKFDRELALFRQLEDDYRQRGWVLQSAQFPLVYVLMAAAHLKPVPVILGVRLDYTNYDAEPPSVRLVDPFSWEPYKARDLPNPLNRKTPPRELAPAGLGLDQHPQVRMMVPQALMQAYDPDEIPFLCLPGVREYHMHPAHTGDSWDLHRPNGEGRLVHLLDIIHRYGVAPITQYNVALVPQISLAPTYVPE